MKDKAFIIASKNGIPQGYVKSISYKNGRFTITQNKMHAKKYATLDRLQGDIDFLTKFNHTLGYIFIYD